MTDTNDVPPSAAAPEQPGGDADRLLAEGVERFEAGDLETAHVLFERAHRKAVNDPRIMSWYGVTLVMVERNSNLGVLYCDQSMRSSGPTPELLLNQARAHLALNQRERAVRAIQRGISSWPDHAGLRLAQDAMGWRRKPVFPCFSRANPLNRWLGRLRHRWYQHRSPPPALSPATLGLTSGSADPQSE
jgi:Flp pilus assembly protein TadD